MPTTVVMPCNQERAPLDMQLKRYHRSFRRRLRRLASGSRPLTDLVYTFPAAAIVLATGQGGATARTAAINLVATGASLRQVGDACRVPMWLRRVPPEAFCEPMRISDCAPCSDLFGRQIVNHLPRRAEDARMWLAWLFEANRLCGEAFALWIAALDIYSDRALEPDAMLPLAAYAWFSEQPGRVARGLIGRPWAQSMRAGRAVEEARSLMLRILLDHCRSDRGGQGRWQVPQRVSGYRFVPLRSVAALQEEGERMNNCVASYAKAVAEGECLIYGIRRGNEHVATVEVRAFEGAAGKPVVAQLEGPGNCAATDAVARAVATWITRQGRFPAVAAGELARAPVDEARWQDLWAPFWEANGIIAQQGRLPVAAQIMRLSNALAALAALAKENG